MHSVQWNCYARNYFLGTVNAINAKDAIKVATKVWSRYNLVESEISVIQSKQDSFIRRATNISKASELKYKYG